MPETQHCRECGRTWEYTHTRSMCPRCGVKTITDCPVGKPIPAPIRHVEIEREFSSLRDRLKRGKDA